MTRGFRAISLAMFGAVLISRPASATTSTCRLQLTNVATDNAGGLYISYVAQPGGAIIGWQVVCNLHEVFHSVEPDACRNWIASALTAQMTSGVAFMFFDDAANGGFTACTLFPLWTAPAITYLGAVTS